MYRSETMNYNRIVFSKESEWKVLEKLGLLGIIQLENLNKGVLHSHRPFETQIKDVTLRLEKINEIESILLQKGYISQKEDFSEIGTQEILNELGTTLEKESNSKYYTDLFEKIDKKYSRIKEQLDQMNNMDIKINLLASKIEVLRILRTQLPKSFAKYERTGYSGNLSLDYFAGTIDNALVFQIQKLLFRITRGNAYITYNTITPEKCCVFIAVQSTGSGQIKDKINRICQSVNFNMIEVPKDMNEMKLNIETSAIDLNEMKNVKTEAKDALFSLLKMFSVDNSESKYSYLYKLKTILLKQICLLENMNNLKFGKTFTSGCFWLPESKTEQFNKMIANLRDDSEFEGLMVEQIDHKSIKKTPPTNFKTKNFFDAFQSIVDTYGIARYKEGNPGLFTAITFPFLFGCMFGDIFHGFGVLVFALFLCFKPEWFSRQFVAIKYLFLFMGIFAFWCGFIYNDFISLPFTVQKSCYEMTSNGSVARISPDCVYPVGVDFAWSQTKTEISFLNSLKMKISIIYGVIQMVMGILIKGTNSLHFGNIAEFFTEFIPQLLFMLCTFGYMVVCILIKWTNDYSADTSKAPSIISLFINLVGKVDYPLYRTAEIQLQVQQILAIIAVVCVPIMLFGKPLIQKIAHRKIEEEIMEEMEENMSLMSHELDGKMIDLIKHEHKDMSEILIHQGIETIEFVLGSVSNTASYLRIWALSLAHSQLARVFYQMILGGFLQGRNSLFFDIPMAIIMFTVLMIVTIGVLMFMDLLECFLHTLRLHWVEFQSKFFKGDGIKFQPFSFLNYVDLNMK